MLNFLPAVALPRASDGHWPWERPSATFAPTWDVIENGWLLGSWTIARLAGPSPADAQTRVARKRNDRGMVSAIRIFREGSPRPVRSMALDYDAHGRLLEFCEASAGAWSRLTYRYDGRGEVIRETSVVRPGPGEPVQVRTAQSFYDAEGRLRRVVVRDRQGRLAECRLLDASGSSVSTRVYDLDGRLEATEDLSRDAQRRSTTLVKVRYDLHATTDLVRPESRRTDRSEYDSDGGLLRREIVDERNRGGEGADVSWCRVAREIIRYDSHVDRPLFDRSEYYSQWPGGPASETVYVLNIAYHYDRDRRLAGSVSTQCDLRGGTAVHSTTRVDHKTEGAPHFPSTLPSLETQPDRRVVHQYRPDGRLRLCRVFDGFPGVQTQAVVYE